MADYLGIIRCAYSGPLRDGSSAPRAMCTEVYTYVHASQSGLAPVWLSVAIFGLVKVHAAHHSLSRHRISVDSCRVDPDLTPQNLVPRDGLQRRPPPLFLVVLSISA